MRSRLLADAKVAVVQQDGTCILAVSCVKAVRPLLTTGILFQHLLYRKQLRRCSATIRCVVDDLLTADVGRTHTLCYLCVCRQCWYVELLCYTFLLRD